MTILETLQFYKEQIESQGYSVYCIMLKGSQNYNLSDEESDIDANAILIPTIAQLRDKVNPKFTFETGEVTCHDIYSFAEIVAKGNPQWIEVCHTDYTVGGDLSMFKHFEVNPSALKGMVMEKVVAFDKLYPARAKYVEQFGYDPKQLHHIIRLFDILDLSVKVHKYHSEHRDYMMNIKRGRYPSTKEEAFVLRDDYVAKLTKIYEEKKLVYKPQSVNYEILDKIVMNHYISTYKA